MNKQLQLLETALPLGNLDAYIHWVNQSPMLSVEEEKSLAQQFRNHNDLEAARRLVVSHLRFVVRVAKGYMGYGLPQADLIQEGNIGLMKAVKRFDPTMGVRLVSFAVYWIKAEIHEFVLKNWRIVKVATTKAQRKLFFNLRKATKHLSWFNNKEIEDVANNLNVSPKEVRAMETRLNGIDESFDGPIDTDDDAAWKAPANYLTDNKSDPALLLEHQDNIENREQNLTKALMTLDERSQDILQQRWLGDKKATLHDLSEKYNVSKERIRQLEQQALNKLKKLMDQTDSTV